MSEGLLVFLVVLGIVAYMVLTQKVIPSLVTKGVNNTVLRGAKREGEELVTQRLTFMSRATVEQVRSAVLSTVKVAPSIPVALADAYLISTSDTLIVFGCGTKMRQSFRGALQLRASNAGTTGTWEIVNWTLADDIVAGQSVMKRLVADIDTALRNVDPSASLR